MAIHLKARLVHLLNRVADDMIAKKMRRKRELRDKRRADATAAWHARLPPARSLDSTNALRIAGSEVSHQSESPFFSKLPLEIRRLVYAEVFTGNELLFQVINESKSAANTDETGKENISFELKCHAARGSLSFPISCKLAYTEALQYVYTCSTFRLTGLTEYWCLTRLVSSQYLDLIRDLHVQYAYTGTGFDRDLTLGTPPYNLRCWKETWDDIARLKGLVRVRIDMFRYELYVVPEDEELYFSSLDHLRRRVELEVNVSWQSGPAVWIWPFSLKRGMVMRKERHGNFSLEAE
ncbi:hypothetical protein FB567DRAFT_44032 [Paraphoma chrysanthemicola]|uniref:DUF7730 domain-containing protein n=1 Tax=Paraphoma chrysanthemicola TaxID=798071 RepID=A0A8K0RJ29_9PLEO|nr:hypothetical protein FB567DRAFT_44032 [Paraphoma chrysanthemicola]